MGSYGEATARRLAEVVHAMNAVQMTPVAPAPGETLPEYQARLDRKACTIAGLIGKAEAIAVALDSLAVVDAR